MIDGFDDISDATEMYGFQVFHMFLICTFGQFVHLKQENKIHIFSQKIVGFHKSRWKST